MSFQGDVAGIGLGELLQGLSRGGRDGVLSLFGHKVSACLGLHNGQLYLLPGPDEDDDMWRERCAMAFVSDPFPEKEFSRRAAIARAARQEAIFRMLSAPNLHFRFEPGPLPVLPGQPAPSDHVSISMGNLGESPSGGPSPWGPGITVEYMLLEHARIADESGSGTAGTLASYDLPRALDAARESEPVVRDFLQECDGSSTIQEISDRLGWPLIQCSSTIGKHVDAGNLRLAAPRELLAAAQHELGAGRIGRASVRLGGWVSSSPPGPPSMGDADLLISEWENGRLDHILHALKPGTGRALMRKLDHIHVDPRAARDRWQSLLQSHRQDEITTVHEVALRLVAAEEPDTRTFQDLLRLARALQERNHHARARTLLRLATNNLPQRTRTLIELGRRMLEAGLVEEGNRLLLNTAHALLDSDDPEMAVSPIQAVLREDAEHGEAGSLLIHARTLLARKKRRRAHSVVGLSVVALLSVGAVVQYRSHLKIENWVVTLQGQVSSPQEALQNIDEVFGLNPPERIAAVRDRLIARKKEQDEQASKRWMISYKSAEEACAFGDPMLGLHRTLELDPRPGKEPGQLATERQDLLGILARRLQARSEELDCAPSAQYQELNQELRFVNVLEEMDGLLSTDNLPDEASSFAFRVAEMRVEIGDRRDKRATERARIASKEKAGQQDILLGAARAHSNAGDLTRSLAAYDRLLEEDESLLGLKELQKEIGAVRRHFEAVKLAVQFAIDGEHEAAAVELRAGCPQPIEHLLPSKVISRPSGVNVLANNGESHTTPFTLKSGVGEKVELTFSLEGYKTRTVRISQPRNLHVSLFRIPDQTWTSEQIVEAAPIPTGGDHILADRYGRILRLGTNGEPVWKKKLSTLGGIARTPLFMPQAPGHLLVVSEDGQVWVIDAATGETEGPHEIGSPPVEGPVLTRAGVTVSFADGRVGVWTDGLEPKFFENESVFRSPQDPQEARGTSLVLLRRRLNQGNELSSPWNDWKVEVMDDEFRISTPSGLGVAVERTGDWVYVAWEAPKALVPNGRLWTSDQSGVHSYVLHSAELVSLE